jgi:hydrogenase assembly chaperone HypC/HupF
MCRGLPGRVVATNDYVATVRFWGEERTVRLELAEEPVAPGDWVLCNLGFVVRHIPKEDLEEVLALYEGAAGELRELRPTAAE